MKVLQPYRNPSEAACFIEGVRRAADVFGHRIDFEFVGGGSGLPTSLALSPADPTPEPVVTIEIPEEDPMLIEDKPVKKVSLKKKIRIAKPDAGTQ